MVLALKDTVQTLPPDQVHKLKLKIKEVVNAIVTKPGLRMIETNNENTLSMLADIEKVMFENYIKIEELSNEMEDKLEITRLERAIWNDRRHQKVTFLSFQSNILPLARGKPTS